jgi:PAS domain S-box-containing protein
MMSLHFVFGVINSLLILFGMLVMCVAIVRGRRLLGPLQKLDLQRRWSLLLRLMIFFVVGYAAVLGLVLAGRLEILSGLTALIFAAGALFVFGSVSAWVVVTQSLLRKEEQFHSFFDAADVGFSQVDPKTRRYEVVNAKMAEITGYSAAELRQLSFSDITHCDDRDRDLVGYFELLEGKRSSYSTEKRYVRKDGSIVWVAVNAVVVKDDAGRTVRAVAVAQDIGERKRREAQLEGLRRDLEQRVDERTGELRQAYAFVNAVVENIPDAIFVKEAKELRVTHVNRSWQELFGFDYHDIVGKSDYDLFPRPQADLFTANDRRVLKEGVLLETLEEPAHTRAKGERILHTKKVPICDESGLPQYLLGIAEDVTDKKRAEEVHQKLTTERIARAESERALRLRDEFISIAAHELRTPLTALRMQIQLLTRLLPEIESEKAATLLSLMRSSEVHLDRFAKLVDDLLSVSRISAGPLSIQRCPAELTGLVRRVAQQYQEELSRAGCSLVLHLPESVVGMWDPSRLEQVLVNLLGNAAKYGAGKPIEISVEARGATARLAVRDHGIGIASADQKRIFDRFERAVSMKTFGGFGLGLFISSQIVKAHGGTLRVESTPGEGACFIVELPCQLSPEAHAPAP